MAVNYKTKMISGFVAALMVTGGGRVNAQGSDSAIMRKLILAYFDGVAAKRFDRLDAVVTRDFVIYENGKVWNNDSVFRNIQQHQPFNVRFTLTNFHVFADVRSGELRCHEHADFVVLDTVKFSLDFIETATFRKTAAGWKISLIHVTAEDLPVVEAPSYYRRYDTVQYVPDYYQKRMETFKGEAVKKGGVVFLGNSITEFGHWKELLGDPGAVNRGIAGDNTFGMLHRLGGVIAMKPAKLFVEAGINDIGQAVPVGMIVGNIMSIVEYIRVKSPGTRVFVVSVLPTNERVKAEYPAVYGKNEVVRELDRRLQEEAGKFGFVYIDLASGVSDEAGNLSARYAREDGLHLNEEGYQVFVGLIRRFSKPAL